jgi:glycosyltransferase involved in cell wall biosynthesis
MPGWQDVRWKRGIHSLLKIPRERFWGWLLLPVFPVVSRAVNLCASALSLLRRVTQARSRNKNVRLVYLSPCILPSRSADTVQVMRMCQAFSRVVSETLLLSKDQPREEPEDGDLYTRYGVSKTFQIEKVVNPALWTRHAAVVFGWLAAFRAYRWGATLAYGRSLHGVLFASRMGIPSIMELHAPIRREDPGWGLFQELIRERRLRRIVVITRHLEQHLVNDWRIEPSFIVVAPNGADDPGIIPAPGPRENVRLQAGYVGHLYRGRGVDVIHDLARRIPEVDFHVFGGTEHDLSSWRETAVGQSNLVFHGYMPPATLPSCYAALEVLLAPYQRSFSTHGMHNGDGTIEASPLKVFEYMAAGRPILASDLPALHGILRHDETALLCAPDRISEWEAALRRLMGDAVLRQRLGAAARREFLEKYTREARASRVLEGFVPVSPSGVIPTLYYLHHWKGGLSVDRKILTKIRYLNECGRPTRGLFATDRPAAELPAMRDVTFVPFIPAPYGRLNSWLHYRNEYYAALLRHLERAAKPGDIVILRFPSLVDRAFHSFIMKAPVTVCAEHNTKEWDEAQATLQSAPRLNGLTPIQRTKQRVKDCWNLWYYRFADRFWKPGILRRIRKGFCVTREIEAFEKSYCRGYETCLVSNSFDATSVAPRRAPHFDGTELRILVINGCKTDWMGLDLVVASLKKYPRDIRVVLVCAGEFSAEEARLAGELEFHRAEFLPYLRDDALDAQFDRCHIAIGTMALFRKNMKEASALKTREYMARGIPFVIGYDDTDLMDDRRWDPYCLRIPEPQIRVAFSDIVAFAARALSRPDHSPAMRNLALETIHTPVKIRRWIEELESALSRR